MDVEVKEIDSFKMIRVGLINYFARDSLLFDCGTTCTVTKLIRNLEAVDYIVVSHAHFDHISGLAVLKSYFPNARVFAHEQIKGLVKKERVIEIWNRENREFCEKFREEVIDFNLNFEILEVEKIDLDGVEVVETPGHSPDSISLLDENGVMLVADALGYPLSSKNIPMYFYSFSEYVKSIEMIGQMADKLCLGHNGAVFDVGYCEVALEEAFRLKKEIQEGLDEKELFKRIYVEELSFYPVSTIEGVAKLLVKRSLEN